MELAIQITSLYNPMLRKVGFKFDLNAMKDGKILNQKNLLTSSDSSNKTAKEEQIEFVNHGLSEFLNKVKNKYPNQKFNIFESSKNINLENASALNNFNDFISSKSVLPLKNTQENNNFIMKTMMFKKTKKDPSLTKEEKKVLNEKASKMRRENKDKTKKIDSFSIDGLTKLRTATELQKQKIYESKILKNKNLKTLFMDAAIISEPKRKRFAILFNIYKDVTDRATGRNCLHKEIIINHGDKTTSEVYFRHIMTEKMNELSLYDKDINFNLNGTYSFDTSTLNFDKNVSKLVRNRLSTILSDKPNAVLVKQQTKMLDLNKNIISSEISHDISIYLKELNNKNNVVLYSDGSVNHQKESIGSGTIVQFQGKDFKIKTNKQNCTDSFLSELHALENGLNHIMENPEMQNKKLFIVYDCDNVPFLLNGKNHIDAKTKESFFALKRIKQLIKDSGCEVYFHGLKSHCIDSVKENTIKNKDINIDFIKNKQVDLLAKEAAANNLHVENKNLDDEIVKNKNSASLEKEVYSKKRNQNVNNKNSKNSFYKRRKRNNKLKNNI